jgi:hypothetical protein
MTRKHFAIPAITSAKYATDKMLSESLIDKNGTMINYSVITHFQRVVFSNWARGLTPSDQIDGG